MGLVRQCNSKLTSYCILGSIREVIEHITLNRREKQDINIVVEELISFGLFGLKNPKLPLDIVLQ
ncbi:MAG: hypothetical protein HZA12_04030 [Nitrospirae bacterium]|nr:hypothetical protein [Nitrospirota bacterium]